MTRAKPLLPRHTAFDCLFGRIIPNTLGETGMPVTLPVG
jgi:hypothetical protein